MKSYRTKVALVRCNSYDDATKAVSKAIELLGGLNVKKDSKILIKPNLLIGKDPNMAVTTHPEIVRPIIDECKKFSKNITVGDSPGTWALKSIDDYFITTGFKKLSEETGVRLLRFGKKTPIGFNVRFGNKKRKIYLEREFIEADYVINVAKLKTHMVTIMTSALKNMYGTIPGNEKQIIHKEAPHLSSFSEAFCSIWKIRKADMNIVDAVVGLEGNGPNYLGKPIKFKYIVAGRDPVAVDTVCARIMGINPKKIVFLKIAERMGLGTMDLRKINIVGDRLKSKRTKLPSTFIHNLWPPFQNFLLVPLTVPKPLIVQEKCIQCGKCRDICPAKAITLKNNKNVIDYSRCIKCFCCQELCPVGAIEFKFPWPFSILMKNKNNKNIRKKCQT